MENVLLEKEISLDDITVFLCSIVAFKKLKNILEENYSLENAIYFVSFILKCHQEINVKYLFLEDGDMTIAFFSKEDGLEIDYFEIKKIIKEAFPE